MHVRLSTIQTQRFNKKNNATLLKIYTKPSFNKLVMAAWVSKKLFLYFINPKKIIPPSLNNAFILNFNNSVENF